MSGIPEPETPIFHTPLELVNKSAFMIATSTFIKSAMLQLVTNKQAEKSAKIKNNEES
jgi:hypothetical protein